MADLPLSEAFRLIDLSSYDVLDTPPENDFDELVELAGQICHCPISFISLLDKDRQWFKSKMGIDETYTSRDVAFCSHAILQDDIMVIEDASKDMRFFDNPFVMGKEGIRFYAGAPIVSAAGHKLGTICILDTKAKKLSKTEERVLTILSNQVTKLLELRKKNMLIRERAGEIITVKSKAISTIITNQEEDKKNIASGMHEDLAQGIASSIFYLRAAEEDKQSAASLIETARNQLQDILIRIQDMSYSITPHILDLIPAKELVHEYVEKIAGTFPFDVQVQQAGADNVGSPDNAVCAIRIIENWLKLLAGKKDVSLVTITIQPNEQFEVLIQDDAPGNNDEQLEREITGSLVYEMTYAQGGTVGLSVSPGKNSVKIKFPVAGRQETK